MDRDSDIHYFLKLIYCIFIKFIFRIRYKQLNLANIIKMTNTSLKKHISFLIIIFWFNL